MPSIPQSQSIDQISYLIPVIIMVILMLLWVPVSEILRSRRERARAQETDRPQGGASTADADQATQLPRVRSERVTLTSPVGPESKDQGSEPTDPEREAEAAGRL